MKRLLASSLAFALLLAACGGGEREAPPTPSPSPAAPAAPTSRCPDPDPGFCAFALELEQALQRGDPEFFLRNARYEDVNCPPEPHEVEACVGKPAGAAAQGIAMSALTVVGSGTVGEGTLASAVTYRSSLTNLFRNAQPQQADRFGDGSARVYAVGLAKETGRKRSIVVTAILPRGRTAIHFTSDRVQGKWVIVSVAQVSPHPNSLPAHMTAGYDWKMWGP